MQTHPSLNKISQSPQIGLTTLPLPSPPLIDHAADHDALNSALRSSVQTQVYEASPLSEICPKTTTISIGGGIAPEPRPLKDYPITVTRTNANSSTATAFMTVGDTLPQDAGLVTQCFDFADLATLRQALHEQFSEGQEELLTYQGSHALVIQNNVLLRFALKAAYYGVQDMLQLQLEAVA